MPVWPLKFSARFVANPALGISWFKTSSVSTLFFVQVGSSANLAVILGLLPTTGGGGKFPFGFDVEPD